MLALAASMKAPNHESAMACAIWWMRHSQRTLVGARTVLALPNFARFIAIRVVKWQRVRIRRLVAFIAKHAWTTLERGDVTAPITLDHCLVQAMLRALVLTRALPLTLRALQCGNINSLFNTTIDPPSGIRLLTF